MPLPIAHGLMGATVIAALSNNETNEAPWKLYLLGALLGVAPDFDYALNWVGVFGRGWHHDFTHSIAFPLLVGCVCALLLERSGVRLRTAFVYGAAMLSHTLLDFLFTESRGVELFWPLSDRRFKFGLTPLIEYTWDTTSLSGRVVDIGWLAMAELATFGALFLLVWLMRQVLWRRASQA